MAVPFKNEFNVCRERFKTGGRLEGRPKIAILISFQPPRPKGFVSIYEDLFAKGAAKCPGSVPRSFSGKRKGKIRSCL
jgi:hypothetical protein